MMVVGKNKKVPFPLWQSCKADGIEQRYIRLGNSQLLHPAMLNLSDKAKAVYIYMLLESGGKMEFEFPRNKYSKISGNNAYQRAKDELINAGFIKQKQSNKNLRKPNVYEFSDEWKRYETPP